MSQATVAPCYLRLLVLSKKKKAGVHQLHFRMADYI